MLTFTKLNKSWNADPNAPFLSTEQDSDALICYFKPNAFKYPEFKDVSRLLLKFDGCSKFRITPLNDHGWFEGQCRFSGLAPSWGEFYEIAGDTRDEQDPTPWIIMQGSGTRHFHFYLRDEALEVKAQDWSLEIKN
ncbi:MAG: hypothetical protein AAFO72_09935 [Pseudomonadota bacterium]